MYAFMCERIETFLWETHKKVLCLEDLCQTPSQADKSLRRRQSTRNCLRRRLVGWIDGWMSKEMDGLVLG